MASLPNPADIRYGGFYLPVFSLIYAHQNFGLPLDISLFKFHIIVDGDNFPFFLGLTFLGALISHGMSRSIYGIEGAKRNPKHRWVVVWYRLLFTFKRVPGKPPLDFDDLWKKLENRSEWFENLGIMQKILLISYRLFRFAVVYPSVLALFGMSIFTTWVLANAALEGTLQTLGILLLVAQSVFFFGGLVFGRFPTAVPDDSAPWLYLAEYHKAKYLHEMEDLEFGYGPPEFSQSITEKINQNRSDPQNRLHNDETENSDKQISHGENLDYLVKLDNNSRSEEGESD